MTHDETPVPLPSAPTVHISQNLILQPPLSRRGHGPGLILLISRDLPLETGPHSLDPPPLQKWAEEGYVVIQITSGDGFSTLEEDCTKALETLAALPECDPKDKIGLVVYSPIPDHAVQVIEGNSKIVGVVTFGSPLPLVTAQLAHQAGENRPQQTSKGVTTQFYASAKSSAFIIPAHVDYVPAASSIAHTRSLTFLKRHMGAPLFDLEAIWDEHTAFEFGNRSVENTMGTMVQEPYVNHIPTMTGGVGRDKLTSFYRNHFIWNNPDDTGLELVSRTVGIDRIIDEFVFVCTHDRVIDWLVPGIPPTGKSLRIPFTSVVNVRGDRLYHEHISWDQATVLVQLGLLPEYLPFPYALPNGKTPASGKRFEYRVPAAGQETAAKLMDENSIPSNGMFAFGIREVDDI